MIAIIARLKQAMKKRASGVSKFDKLVWYLSSSVPGISKNSGIRLL